jgi:glycosyltransferase involved in cell wall biosynthesis
MSLTLILPAWNEERRLPPFLSSVATFLKTHPALVDEVIVVDDGSTDRTAEVAKSFGAELPGLRVISHERNLGKGAAVRTGILEARSDNVVFMDADGATPVEELPKMAQALAQSDIGIGHRWLKGAATTRHSPLRRLGGWIYRSYMGLFGLGHVDTMCGFKGYRRTVATDLYANLLETGWLFDTEVAYRAVRKGYRITSFPIRWASQEGSKLSARTLVLSAFRIWPLVRRVNRNE